MDFLADVRQCLNAVGPIPHTHHHRYPSGESYLDVIQRVEPVVIEMERERECVCIVAHQAVLRAVYGYFMDIPQVGIGQDRFKQC